MNLYHCMIELRHGAQALAFASAAEAWLASLRTRGLIGDWQLYRRKLGLGSARHSDFLIQIEVDSLAQLDRAFGELSSHANHEDQRLYERMHDMIGTAEVALYRPYPDPEQRETIALI